ncbi:MAG: DUF1294 domain-containing protein [Sphingopyxis sp.]|uniref:DUF1294 domain-containing protein n=1 Tax=Sphingopyxis sp. TaxID=1908224 RepID=UPI002ABAEE6D|nr:DUF1294 domain-containing protein [Sphingopyxis sp.]MDZ3831519.1 DUF1294 domain-containing protein [Sphingopyxis sp.]
MTEYIIYGLIAANGIAFILMVFDKRYAENGSRRVPESTLLFWAFAGGAFGTVAASRLVRHKTRKRPFATWMMIWFWLQLILLLLWALGILEPLLLWAFGILKALVTAGLAEITGAA